MRLTKQTGHAIRILVDCAQAGDGLVKVADISKRLGVTKQNVFKIVHILTHTGFLTAMRGPAGGVRLARPAKDIRIGDVVRAIEVTRVQIGDGEDDSAADRQAVLNAVFDDALAAFITVLDQHTLSELARGQGAALLPETTGSAARRRTPAAATGRRSARASRSK